MASFFESKEKKSANKPEEKSKLGEMLDRLTSEYHKYSGVPREQDMPWSEENVQRLRKKQMK